MTCSACCTTPSKAGDRLRIIVTVLACIGLSLSAQGQAVPRTVSQGADTLETVKPDALDAWIRTNTLPAEGKLPFHLHSLIQLYDLTGKPKESGFLDFWWGDAAGHAVRLQLPSLGTRNSLEGDLHSTPDEMRTLFLVRQLLEAETDPMEAIRRGKSPVVGRPDTLGKVPLLCLSRDEPRPQAPAASTPDQIKICLDPVDHAVRFIHQSACSVLRNTMGHLSSTEVALSNTISWNGQLAITGTTDSLTGFTAASSPVPLTKDEPVGSVEIRGLKKIAGVVPQYPFQSRQAHSSGTVVLVVLISAAGAPESIAPVASPDPVLTGAAMRAVSTWRWTPPERGGVPHSVLSTIQVAFNLSVRP